MKRSRRYRAPDGIDWRDPDMPVRMTNGQLMPHEFAHIRAQRDMGMIDQWGAVTLAEALVQSRPELLKRCHDADELERQQVSQPYHSNEDDTA